MKFKAAVLVESRKPLVIEELEVPALKYGQVLVKMIASGICGAQVNEIEAVKGEDKFLPHLLGHEATADVIDCGEGVTTVQKGDRVVCHWRKGAGIHAPTAQYRSARGMINSGWVTTFSQYSVVSENRVTKIPKDFDTEIGALMGCAITTAMGVIRNDAQLGMGESVAVFGSGGVGLNIIQFASLSLAHPIIAVDLYDHKLELAKQLGATHTINASSGNLDAQIRDIVGQHGVDVAIENTGVADVIETAYNVTSPKGKTVLVGVLNKNGKYPSFYTLPLHFEKTLTGSEGGSSQPDIDIPKLIRLVQSGKLKFGTLISKRFPLSRINEAIDDLRRGRVAGRCIIDDFEN